MQINGIGTDMSLRSATYDSTKATADAKEFSRELQAAANNLRSADSASAPAAGTTAAQL